jgi:hypothetical protein
MSPSAGWAHLPGQWIDLVHGRRPPRGIVLDMDSSVSPTHGEQEMSVWNGHLPRASLRGSLWIEFAHWRTPRTSNTLEMMHFR